MHDNHTRVLACILAAAASSALADIVRVDEFDSGMFEGFQDLDIESFDQDVVRIFDGAGSVYSTASGGDLHATGSWSFMQRVSSYEGTHMLGGNYGIGYSFDSAQKSFGGYFSSIIDNADGEIRFYSGEQLVGTDLVHAPTDTTWAWNGWSSDQSFDRVEIDSHYSTRGYLMHDAIRLLSTSVPSPGGSVLAVGGLLVLVRRRR
ncbi:MAG: hypothetical protein KDA29_10595 [Phycisphaerales bacterium]|nr:hypothetical protein [Phycisphaerales bacterium]